MPAALKKPTLDELYRRLRDLDYTQIDERMAVMPNAILQLEEQGECRESATEAVLMVGYTTEGISNQEQTRWLSWNVDGGVRGFDLARNPGLSNNTEYGAGEFPLPTRPSARSTGQSSSKVPSMTRAQQTTEAYPDLGVLKKELEKTQTLRLLEMLRAEHQQEPQMKESGEKTNNLESAKKMEPGSCLDSTCGSGEHTCDRRSCVRILSFQKEDLVTWFEDITEREKSEVQIVAECYARTTVNIATALGFFSRMCSLQSLERLESEHHLVTALSVESWPGVLQVTQKHIRSWKVGLEAEMGFPMSEAYGLPLNAISLIGSMMANLCGSHHPLHMAMVEASSQRILVDKAFSVPKCVRLARVSHHSHKLLRKIRATVPKELRDDLSEIWGEELMKLESENTSDHERQNVIGKPVGGAPNMGENDTMHEKMMELEPLLEASGERNLRSIEITHREGPCHCLAQTVWYPDHKNLCLVWDMEEIRSIGLPDHRQKVTLLVVSTMLALRWIEENITKYREAKTPTAESIYAIDYSRRLELFETACKVFAIPMEVRHVWSR